MTSKTEKRGMFEYTVSVICMASFISGAILGFSSAAVGQLNISTYWISQFSSIVNLGGMIGTLLCGELVSRIGRKRSMIYSCFPCICSWISLLYSYDITLTSPMSKYFMLIFGRVLSGVACGMYTTITVTYLIEITHPHSTRKGLIASLNQLSLVIGIAFAYYVGMYSMWYNACKLYLLLSIVHLVLLYFTTVPESPKWLSDMGLAEQANSEHVLLHGIPIDPSTKVAVHHIPRRISLTKVLLPCTNIPSSLLPRLSVAFVLLALQQMTGVNGILFFTESICRDAGAVSPSFCAFQVGLAQVFFTFVAVFIMDSFPRRVMLQACATLMAIAQFSFALAKVNKVGGAALLGCIILFFFGYAVAWGPLPYVVAMEMFPAQHRGTLCATLSANWILTYLVTLYFLPLSAWLGVGPTFIAFGICCVLAGVFVKFFVPETNPRYIHDQPSILPT